MSANKKTLIIFTTSWIHEDKSDEKYLFRKETIKTISSNDKPKEQRIFKLNDENQLIFATEPLSRNISSEKEKLEFIDKILTEVINCIDSIEKDNIEHIILVLHRHELGYTDDLLFDFGSKNNNSTRLDKKVFNKVNEKFEDNCQFLDKSLSKDKIDKSKIKVDIIGFQHEPDNFIYGYLNNIKKQKITLETFTDDFLNEIEKVKDIFSTSYYLDNFKNFEDHPVFGTHNNQFRYWQCFYKDENWTIKEATDNNNKPVIINSTKEKVKRINVVALSSTHLWNFQSTGLIEKIADDFFSKSKLSRTPEPLIIVVKTEDNLFLKSKDENIEIGYLDKRFRFLDSNIWCRTVEYIDGKEAEFETAFKAVMETIEKAFDWRLYHKNVCKEYIEFQSRLIKSSKIEHSFGDGHASAVVPFKFHSETAMAQRAKEEHEALSEKGIQWNLLLIDDYALASLKEKEEQTEDTAKVGKKAIIEYWLNYLDEYDSLLDDKLDVIENIDDAKSKIENKRDVTVKDANNKDKSVKHIYDIILLDYLFSLEQENDYKYGTELLKIISDETDIENRLILGKSVGQSYWIYPISAFPEAMTSDFQEKSIQHLEKDWQLARGADPINTPHLFRCGLFEFMRTQFEKVYFSAKTIFEFLEKYPFIQDEGKSYQEAQREWAAHVFRRYIERFSGIEGLHNSPFKTTMNEHLHQDSIRSERELMQSVRQLLFYLAFSTGHSAPVIKMELNQIINLSKNIFGDDYKKEAFPVIKRIGEFVHKTNHKSE
jgi:hypothetical protein